FSVAVKESVTALLLDETDQFWVGTAHGLWRNENSVWTRFSMRDGLPADRITAIAGREAGLIVVGTTAGVATLQNGTFKILPLPPAPADSAVTAVAVGPSNVIYAGCKHGLLVYRDSAWTFYDTGKGLVSVAVSALFCTEDSTVWVGGDNGITLWNEKSWKRYKFGQSRTAAFAPYPNGRMWIATDRGAILYTPGKTDIDKNGNPVRLPPQWKAYHTKNALSGDRIAAIAVQGNDVWIASEGGIDRFEYAERQVELFYEPLLPAAKLPDLWHSYGALVWPTEEWGTLGFNINFTNFGSYDLTDEFGKVLGNSRAWESVFSLSYGFAVQQDFSLGLNAKYIYSVLASGLANGMGIGQTFAIDAALLKRNLGLPGLDIGFGLFNMGPPIYYEDPNRPDPLPFTARLGLCYRAIQTPVFDFKVLTDIYREIVKTYPDGQPDPFYKAIVTDLINNPDESWRNELDQVLYSLGAEFWYINMIALRIGGLIDRDGQRHELTPGLGIRYGNLNFDWSYIYSPKGSEMRNQQQRYSLIFRF
ncbi:MAG: PorV/PorQ family protein, partial [Chitinivibrionales bacterium]|nr:PorV/PorQ family protein [Chitinivibrionales bacterium]